MAEDNLSTSTKLVGGVWSFNPLLLTVLIAPSGFGVFVIYNCGEVVFLKFKDEFWFYKHKIWDL